MNYKNIFISSIFLLLLFRVSAQGDTETRTFSKRIAVNRETILEVSNKYGTIHITPWNRDSAYIKAEVIATASDQSKIKKMFNGVNVNITESNLIVRAQTDFTQNISMLFEDFKGITSKLISYDSRVEINYYISIPEYIDLNIENKYGDVYMENATGSLSVTVSNGSFKANSIGKDSYIKLSFCDADINTIKSGKIDASFSELTIGESNDLTINSISSRYDIKKCGSVITESRRDKFFIKECTSIRGNSYFTDFNIDNLESELDIECRYGNLSADMISKNFRSITINSGYTDLNLGFDQSCAYNLDIRQINSFLILPDRNTKTEKKVINEDKKEYMTFGTIGKNPGNARVKIDATRGNIYLK